jgi:hypothetical protein
LAKQAEKIYLSQGEIKYAILAYLLLRDKPKNASDIQLYCLQRKREDRIDRKKEGVLHTQAADRFKNLLTELCDKKMLEKIAISDKQSVYQITQRGRDTVELIKHSDIKNVFFGFIDKVEGS